MMGAGSASTTPAQDGFYIPADTCRHARMWLPWPRDEHAALRSAVANLAHVISEFEPVNLVVTPGDERAADDACGSAVEIVSLAYVSPRLRDTGPTYLVDGKGGAAATNWRFNGWGGRGPCPPSDEVFAHTLLGLTEVRRFRAPLTLEPSTFVSDGADTLLALAPAIFDDKRNPGLSRLEAFAILQHWLGSARVIWLEQPHPADNLENDVRALVAFIDPGKIVISKAQSDHPHAPFLARTANALRKSRDAQGKDLDLIEVPAPPVRDGAHAPLSYTTALPVNRALLVPTFDAVTDNEAAAALAGAFPERAMRTVPAAALAEAGLTLSSLAIPQPARLVERNRASVLPRSARAQPAADLEAFLQRYIDLVSENGS